MWVAGHHVCARCHRRTRPVFHEHRRAIAARPLDRRAAPSRPGWGPFSARAIMHEPLQDTLRQRTPWAVVTPAFVGINIAVFAMMVMGPHPIGDPDTLVAYGGNFEPRTTNGEWGRLITAVFVHGNAFDLLINIAALISVGLLLERLVGLTFLAVYLGAGALYEPGQSLDITRRGLSWCVAAIFGLYGLLLASWAHGTVQQADNGAAGGRAKDRSDRDGLCRLQPAVGSHRPGRGEHRRGGGFCCRAGARTIHLRGRPHRRKVGMTMATAAVMVMIAAIPLRGVADMRRPVLAQVLAVEEHIAREYDVAVKGFTKGRMNAKALAALIDEKVTPSSKPRGKQVTSLRTFRPNIVRS